VTDSVPATAITPNAAPVSTNAADTNTVTEPAVTEVTARVGVPETIEVTGATGRPETAAPAESAMTSGVQHIAVHTTAVTTVRINRTTPPVAVTTPARTTHPEFVVIAGERYGTDSKVLTISNSDFSRECLRQLSYMTNLQRLWLSDNRGINDISFVANMKDLFRLNIRSAQINDLSPLNGLTNLVTLHLEEVDMSRVTDFSPIAKLTNLRELTLQCESITDISFVSGLTNLEEIRLIDAQVSDISPLKGLNKLLSVLLAHNDKLTDISVLGSLSELIIVGVYDLCNVRDLSVLDDLFKLSMVLISPCHSELVSDEFRKRENPWGNPILILGEGVENEKCSRCVSSFR
jgi:Leucine-rich repeat (LRR) protein